jgi:hypothetical protein
MALESTHNVNTALRTSIHWYMALAVELSLASQCHYYFYSMLLTVLPVTICRARRRVHGATVIKQCAPNVSETVWFSSLFAALCLCMALRLFLA